MTADRLHAAHSARRSATEHKHQRVHAAIDQILKTGGTLSISAIARLAGTSRGFITTHHQEAIDTAIAQHADRLRASDSRTHPSIASLRAENHGLRQQARTLSAENQTLRRRLSRSIGAEIFNEAVPVDEADAGRVKLLESDLVERDQRIHELEEELRDLREDLEAARVANRRLLKELNARPMPS